MIDYMNFTKYSEKFDLIDVFYKILIDFAIDHTHLSNNSLNQANYHLNSKWSLEKIFLEKIRTYPMFVLLEAPPSYLISKVALDTKKSL